VPAAAAPHNCRPAAAPVSKARRTPTPVLLCGGCVAQMRCTPTRSVVQEVEVTGSCKGAASRGSSSSSSNRCVGSDS
jgi:hypothetical protein